MNTDTMSVWEVLEACGLAEEAGKTIARLRDAVASTVEASARTEPALSASRSSEAEDATGRLREGKPMRQLHPRQRLDEMRKRLDDHVLSSLRGPIQKFVSGEVNWFPDPEMRFVVLRDLSTRLSGPLHSEAELEIAAYVRSRTPRFLELLAGWHPKRDRILRRAFAAHERAEFELSVPVLLAQADGISADLTGFGLFQGKHRSALGKVFEGRATRFRRILLNPLAEKIPLNQSQSDRKPSPDVLNRHAVLHGEAVDYATEANSLRAVSLLFYVAYVLRFVV